jgi:hypothetical protein
VPDNISNENICIRLHYKLTYFSIDSLPEYNFSFDHNMGINSGNCY